MLWNCTNGGQHNMWSVLFEICSWYKTQEGSSWVKPLKFLELKLLQHGKRLQQLIRGQHCWKRNLTNFKNRCLLWCMRVLLMFLIVPVLLLILVKMMSLMSNRWVKTKMIRLSISMLVRSDSEILRQVVSSQVWYCICSVSHFLLTLIIRVNTRIGDWNYQFMWAKFRDIHMMKL